MNIILPVLVIGIVVFLAQFVRDVLPAHTCDVHVYAGQSQYDDLHHTKATVLFVEIIPFPTGAAASRGLKTIIKEILHK